MKNTNCTCGANLTQKETIFTMKQTAEYLGLHYDTVKEMAAKREIPYVVVKKRKRFYLRHLNGWLEKRMVKSIA